MDFNLLKQISEEAGVSGFETRIRDLIINQISPYVDSVDIDNLGNVIALKKGKENKKIMAAAHMDEIGFIVSHIDEEGFIKFQPLGGFDPKTLTAQRVIIHGKKDLVGVMGTKPIHMMTEEEKSRKIELDHYFIDLGMKKEEVEKYVEVGDPITRERSCIEMGDCVNGKSLDNRISVYILIEALKQLKDQEIPYDFYAVFTVQEEVGIRGAQVATQSIEPDFGFAIDTTIAYDVPGARAHEKVTSLGKGVAIKLMDATAISDARMTKFMKNTANHHQITWQPELMAKGGTDTGHIQRMVKNGSIAGGISIPTRHIHQVIESVHKEDIESGIKLLTACITDMADNNWYYG